MQETHEHPLLLHRSVTGKIFRAELFPLWIYFIWPVCSYNSVSLYLCFYLSLFSLCLCLLSPPPSFTHTLIALLYWNYLIFMYICTNPSIVWLLKYKSVPIQKWVFLKKFRNLDWNLSIFPKQMIALKNLQKVKR